jgi:hypothetical protein
MLTARDECDVLAGSGQLRSKVTARATCPVDRKQSFMRMTVVPAPIRFANIRNCCIRICVFRLKRCN